MPRPGRVRAVLDTDTYNEIDDQFALVQALLSPDRIALEAIYAAPFHNTRSSGPGDGMDKSYEEILRLLGRMGRSPDGFVFKGVRDFVGFPKQALKAEAVDHLIARARASSPDDPLCVIAIAAISNVASALIAAPDVADKIIVVWLGGHALEWPDTREFNLRQDVGGAQVLLDSGAPLVLIPCMGVTSHCTARCPKSNAMRSLRAKLASRRTLGEYSDDHLGWSKEIWDMALVGWPMIPTGRRRCLPSRS
jgi:inosine-uridine nucleoside N-ribohydrolase